MSRIKSAFDRLAAEGRKALIPFITAGDPDAALTVPLMHAMVEAGADVIELGVPFSDPMADGPTIQRASERALARGLRSSPPRPPRLASMACWSSITRRKRRPPLGPR